MSSLHRPRLQRGGVQSKINMYGGVLFLQNSTHNQKVQVQNYWMHTNEKTLFCSGQSRKFSGSQWNPLTTGRSRKGNNTGTKTANYSPTEQKEAVSAKPQKCSYASPHPNMPLPPAPVTRPESVFISFQFGIFPVRHRFPQNSRECKRKAFWDCANTV